MSLFGQDSDTSTSTMLLNLDQLHKQLDKDDFPEDESMTAFLVIKRQFQKFIDSQFTLDYDSQMTYKYFVEYTGIEVKQFRETLLQHMSNVKKSVAESTRHQIQFERRVNTRQMQTQETKIDTYKALDVDLVVTESSRTESEVQDESNKSGNDTDVDDRDIRPVYDEEPMAEVQLTAECNIFAIGQQHTEQPTYKDLYDSIIKTRVQTKVHNDSLIVKLNNKSTKNANLRAQLQEKVFAIAALKNELRKLKGNSVDTKFARTSVLRKPVLQSLKNQTVVRQPNAFKSERPSILKLQFTSQVDVNKNLSKSVT
nr:hypothetical protein [Tanacetum cinerariifolium]